MNESDGNKHYKNVAVPLNKLWIVYAIWKNNSIDFPNIHVRWKPLTVVIFVMTL